MKKAQLGKKHTPLVIGNWKENPQTHALAQKLVIDVKKSVPKKGITAIVAVATPSVFIAEAKKGFTKTRVQLAAQDCSHEEGGAFTGEVSVSMLKSFGVTHVIVGHSERRALGESDERVALKVQRVLKAGLTAVVCIGEKKRDTQGDYFNTVESQLRSVLAVVPKGALSRLVVAYEPIWAIGTGKHATAEDVQEMKLFIQKVIADAIARTAVSKVRVLYGGSVSTENAESLLHVGKADGFLIGGTSLKAADFAFVVKIADTYGS
jgi:triosephosphate isomerase (TIM)